MPSHTSQSANAEAPATRPARQQFVVFCGFLLLRLLIMIFRPLSDPSETRYGNMAAGMAASGNYIEPKFVYNGSLHCFEGKPPLFFQAGAVACRIFGKNAFAVKLPSLVCSLATIWLVFAVVRRASDKRTAWDAALLCFLNPVFFAYSGLCVTDMMLTFCLVGGVIAYANFSREAGRRQAKMYSLLFFVFMALGMLVKGPIAIVGVGLPVFMYVAIFRKWKELRHHAWIGGLIAFVIIVLPWYLAMEARNPGFLEYFFYHENFARFFLADYGDKFGSGHESFYGVAVLIAMAMNLPALLLLLKAARAGRHRPPGMFKNQMEVMSLIAAVSLTAFWCPTNRVPFSYWVLFCRTNPLFG